MTSPFLKPWVTCASQRRERRRRQVWRSYPFLLPKSSQHRHISEEIINVIKNVFASIIGIYMLTFPNMNQHAFMQKGRKDCPRVCTTEQTPTPTSQWLQFGEAVTRTPITVCWPSSVNEASPFCPVSPGSCSIVLSSLQHSTPDGPEKVFLLQWVTKANQTERSMSTFALM